MVKQLTADQASQARQSVLRWFRKKARPLPWRTSRRPYRVWLSEIMLQQTQVDTVIPYFRRFVRVFPSVRVLAAARLEKILEMWSGLGYYRRARHLHQAAQAVAREHQGRFPRTWEALRSLPGVGDYTARAILSMAFGQRYAVLDGNAARVMARLLALRGNIRQARFRKAVERQLEKLLSPAHPGDFNQAIMEIGQTICRPREPQCPECPLRRWCRARRRGRPEAFPAPLPRRPAETRHLATAVIVRNRRLLLMKGLDGGLLPDVWNFPSAFGSTPRQAAMRLQAKLAPMAGGSFWLGRQMARFRHNITYRSISAQVYLAEAALSTRAPDVRWFTSTQLRTGALSQLARKTFRGLEGRIPELSAARSPIKASST